MDPFVVILLAGLAALVIWVVMLGRSSGGGLDQLDWKSPREVTEAREALEADDLAEMLAAHNARRRRRGEAEVTLEQVERAVMEQESELDRLRELRHFGQAELP